MCFKKKAYIDLYFYRIFLTNSALFVFGAQLIGDLLGVKKEQINRVVNYATGYSLALQIVNDNADFVYKFIGKEGQINHPVCKKDTDILCDLRNKIITLPLAFHLGVRSKKSNKKVRYLLNLSTQNKKIEIIPALILEEMVISEAIPNSIKIGRAFAERAKQFLSPANPATEMLSAMLEIANWNKYYYSLNKFKNSLHFERAFNNKGSKHSEDTNQEVEELDRKYPEKQKYYLESGRIVLVQTPKSPREP